MVTRYSDYKLMSYCFSPRTVIRDGEKYVVPCGKCDGCLLHKSNLWSSRIQQEIDANPYSLFVTYTYNNKYLPTLKRVPDPYTNGAYWVSDHPDNIRFDGSKDVRRTDRIMLRAPSKSYKIQNDSRTDVINYASKRDIQLYLKLLKEDLKLSFHETGNFFRYFICSEVGPTTLRCHFHALFFCSSRDIAEALLVSTLYKDWQMCDETLFKLHASYCDSGTARYVANYVNSINSLPEIYQNRELRPFRLSSKSPAIGFGSYDPQEVEESHIVGDGTYIRTVSRTSENHILRYSSDYLHSIFPKCYRFSELPFARLLYVYGYLYRAIRGTGQPYFRLSSRLSKIPHSSDWLAMRKCYEYCEKYGCTPFHYLYVLDQVYYRSAMCALRMQYEYLERKKGEYLANFAVYTNLLDYVGNVHFLSDQQRLTLEYFMESYNIYDIDMLDVNDFVYDDPDLLGYMKDVIDICANLQKMPKYNELSGNAPHIV